MQEEKQNNENLENVDLEEASEVVINWKDKFNSCQKSMFCGSTPIFCDSHTDDN